MGFLQGQFITQTRYHVIAYDQPATVSTVITGFPVNIHPNGGFFIFLSPVLRLFSTVMLPSSTSYRFLAAAASACSIASKLISFETPFSLDTASATRRISLLTF